MGDDGLDRDGLIILGVDGLGRDGLSILGVDGLIRDGLDISLVDVVDKALFGDEGRIKPEIGDDWVLLGRVADEDLPEGCEGIFTLKLKSRRTLPLPSTPSRLATSLNDC